MPRGVEDGERDDGRWDDGRRTTGRDDGKRHGDAATQRRDERTNDQGEWKEDSMGKGKEPEPTSRRQGMEE